MFYILSICLSFVFVNLQADDYNRLKLDFTHDPDLKSWVQSANSPVTDFPIQNLPFGIFKRSNTNECLRIGVAIGDQILDVKRCVTNNLLNELDLNTRKALKSSSLNPLMSLSWKEWKQVRQALFKLLMSDSVLANDKTMQNKILTPLENIKLYMPVEIGNYTDFYASIEHAMHVGSIFRPANPLLPNYRHMPIAYHGRASSIVISNTPITRPKGLYKKNNESPPELSISEKLDYEVELGMFIGQGNEQGRPIEMKDASHYIFGFVIVNDWSARDIQSWEYQPLGPFNGKNFATTISPWVVTLDALLPFCVAARPRTEEDPPLADYLIPDDDLALNLIVDVTLCSEQMKRQKLNGTLISETNVRNLYWTFPQMIVQHTLSGCNLKPGDLIASGTISGSLPNSYGCLLEYSNLNSSIILDDDSFRNFLKDGDEVTMQAYSNIENYPRIGFGLCTGTIQSN